MGVARVFGDIHTIEHELGIRNQCVPYDYRFSEIYSNADFSTRVIKIGKLSFRLANLWCYRDYVIRNAKNDRSLYTQENAFLILL